MGDREWKEFSLDPVPEKCSTTTNNHKAASFNKTAGSLKKRPNAAKFNNATAATFEQVVSAENNINNIAQTPQEEYESHEKPPHQQETKDKKKSKVSLPDKPVSVEQPTGGDGIHPPGYNKRKRDIVKLVLVVVALSLLRGDPKVATILSIVAVLCLKEGTFWSTRNLKWMALCIMSFFMGLASWSLERASDDISEAKEYTLNSTLWVSSKIIQACWGMTLTVFLASAYAHGHNSFLEFEFLHEGAAKAAALPGGPRRNPPPKTYLLY